VSAPRPDPREGLVETMRGEGGAVVRLDRHLDRLLASAAALGLEVPDRTALGDAVRRAVAAEGSPHQRVRLVAAPGMPARVEVRPEPPLEAAPAGVSAAALRGAWRPGERLAEHKLASLAGHAWARHEAERRGAERALLLDELGRLGEADGASVVCVLGGEWVAAPAEGLLAGTTLAALAAERAVRREALGEPEWRAADEILLLSAVRGVVAAVRCDGAPVGSGRPGPAAREALDRLRALAATDRLAAADDGRADGA
jgi:branched-chain amino acid aminotransferase